MVNRGRRGVVVKKEESIWGREWHLYIRFAMEIDGGRIVFGLEFGELYCVMRWFWPDRSRGWTTNGPG